MRLAVCFPLFFAILALTISNGYSQSGSIKICAVGPSNDTELRATIDNIALFIAKNHTKAPQIHDHELLKGDVCEFIGGVDRAKLRADFILVAKRSGNLFLNCDPEWGRQSFAIINFYTKNMSAPTNKNHTFNAKLAFTSKEESKAKWKNVRSEKELLELLIPRFMSPQSRIPDDYSFRAEREERVKRRTLKAVIALMALVVSSLLVIMFIGSLSRYNEEKKKRDQEEEKKKKFEKQAEAAPAELHKSEKSTKKEE
ncbi:unnamed protein product [Caenorhabditis sp. 36 PRJEB53466]|nr:unnamed protein product [Caenorhabditis sp. 36 PRJEB53466]